MISETGNAILSKSATNKKFKKPMVLFMPWALCAVSAYMLN